MQNLLEDLEPFRVILRYCCLQNRTSISAFDCLNELFGRSFVPKALEAGMLQMGQLILNLLQSIVDSDKLPSEEYLTKFTQFMYAFSQNHLQRCADFPVQAFLQLMYKFTFIQVDLMSYLSCLDIWDGFIDTVKLATEDNMPAREPYVTTCHSQLTQQLF